VYKAKFIWVENGSDVVLDGTGIPGVSGVHKLVGFKLAPGRKVGGWLVVLIAPRVPGLRPRSHKPVKAARV
jgi:hypothetical protein